MIFFTGIYSGFTWFYSWGYEFRAVGLCGVPELWGDCFPTVPYNDSLSYAHEEAWFWRVRAQMAGTASMVCRMHMGSSLN